MVIGYGPVGETLPPGGILKTLFVLKPNTCRTFFKCSAFWSLGHKGVTAFWNTLPIKIRILTKFIKLHIMTLSFDLWYIQHLECLHWIILFLTKAIWTLRTRYVCCNLRYFNVVAKIGKKEALYFCLTIHYSLFLHIFTFIISIYMSLKNILTIGHIFGKVRKKKLQFCTLP